MIDAILLALIAAVFVALAAIVLKRPREWVVRSARRVGRAWSPRRLEAIQLAIERIDFDLTERRCQEEGNPDDEFRDDWCRWFTGDPDANVDYKRKQQRDRERLERGDFNPR